MRGLLLPHDRNRMARLGKKSITVNYGNSLFQFSPRDINTESYCYTPPNKHQFTTTTTTATTMAYKKDFQKGNKVITRYGQGVVTTSPRPDDGIVVVQLDFAKMYLNPAVHPMRKNMTNDEINASFQAMEKMRKLNLEVECNELGIICDHSKCKACLLATATSARTTTTTTEKSSSSSSSYFTSIRIANPLASSSSSSSNKKKVEPCLLCASPTCSKHTSKALQKERITLCLDCEALFQTKSLNLQHDLDAASLQAQLERLIDPYDSAFLLLRYSAPFIPTLVQQLQAQQATDDKVTLGTSSVGFVSSIMGLAGAATLLTPAGPPLLAASFIFGTSNAAVGLGYSAQKHYQQDIQTNTPHGTANRLLTLYGFLQAAMERIVTLGEQVDAEPSMGKVESSSSRADSANGTRNAYLEALSQGISVTKTSNNALRIGNAAGYTASSSVFEMMGAAPVIGQAFSAAMMVLDYQTARATLEKIQTVMRGSRDTGKKGGSWRRRCFLLWAALLAVVDGVSQCGGGRSSGDNRSTSGCGRDWNQRYSSDSIDRSSYFPLLGLFARIHDGYIVEGCMRGTNQKANMRRLRQRSMRHPSHIDPILFGW